VNSSNWIRVNRENPCPICEHSDACSVSANGTEACCSRVPSDKLIGQPFAGGYIHKLTDPSPVPKRTPKRPVKPAERAQDFYALSKQYRENLTPMLLTSLRFDLCVSEESLLRLGIGYDGRNYSFPMRDGGDGEIVGIKLRSPNGKKFCVPTSNLGLYWPYGVEADSNNLLFIAEGESDTAALLDMGFDAIGRPSCSGGTEHIKTLLTRHDRQVIIMADKDTPKTRPDGSVWRPGQEGAYRLAAEIKSIVRSVRVIKPSVGKDVRQWYIAGAIKAVILAVAKNAKFL